LVDDALDYTLSEERFGKPTGNDILEGKVTLPLILLREKASTEERAKLQKILDAGLDKNSVEYIKSLVAKYKTVESTLARAKEFSDLAISSLDIFPPSYIKENLIALTDYLVWREV
jgi:octaprenyl-diphosphate synthase